MASRTKIKAKPSKLLGLILKCSNIFSKKVFEFFATKLYNGNISETFWKTSTDNVLRKYDYKYDDLNRLLQADYSKEANYTFNSYLEHLSYDKNGNIKTLLRNGGMDTDGLQFANPIDNLTYLYDTDNKNLLLKVIDDSFNPQGFKDGTNTDNDYSYDDNGNLIKDNNKNIKTIKYNHLNLPTQIIFVNGNKIFYLYNAVGQKVRKSVDEIINNQAIFNQTDYLAGFQYHNNVLKHFSHAEGYVNVVKNTTSYEFKYVFNYTDHLGNIRLSYTQDPASNVLKILEENHYYPFGLKHSGYNSDRLVLQISTEFSKFNNWQLEEVVIKPFRPTSFNLSSNYDYKYNGKEYQDELGLNLYDYGARNYDAAIGRWMNVDPLTERHPEISPFVYCANNPIKFIDPDGRDWVEASNGDITWRKDVNSKNHSKTLKDGEIYRGKSYERIKEWNNVTTGNGDKVSNIVLENYGNNKKMTYSEMTNSSMSVEGSMIADDTSKKMAYGSLSINLKFENGQSRYLDNGYFEVILGGFGNGAPENGNYTVTNFNDRGPNSNWPNKAMTVGGLGFSYNLNPLFSTGRSDLRIHPDGNSLGTEGCIGLLGNVSHLKRFSEIVNTIMKHQNGTIPLSINIFGNPNNDGIKVNNNSKSTVNE